MNRFSEIGSVHELGLRQMWHIGVRDTDPIPGADVNPPVTSTEVASMEVAKVSRSKVTVARGVNSAKSWLWKLLSVLMMTAPEPGKSCALECQDHYSRKRNFLVAVAGFKPGAENRVMEVKDTSSPQESMVSIEVTKLVLTGGKGKKKHEPQVFEVTIDLGYVQYVLRQKR